MHDYFEDDSMYKAGACCVCYVHFSGVSTVTNSCLVCRQCKGSVTFSRRLHVTVRWHAFEWLL